MPRFRCGSWVKNRYCEFYRRHHAVGNGHEWLIFPVASAISTELLPNRRAVTPKVGLTMAASTVINAVGEELLWRGAYLDVFSR